MLKNAKNYYDILGVTPDVEMPELKSVYRRLVRKYHPDINPAGEERFRDITEAYQTLSNENLRKKYDTLNGFFKSTYHSKTTESMGETYRKSFSNTDNVKSAHEKVDRQKTDKKKVDENTFTEKLNKFIDGFSKPAKKKKVPPKAEKGGDIYVDVALTLRESITGTHKIVNVVNTKSCEHCRGRKFINNSKCPVCNGVGEISEHQKIDVTIPANVKNGAKLRLTGEGKKGVNGGKNGDLYLKITITPDSFFKVDGNDLLVEIPISPFEAILGGDITVPSLDGAYTLTIPQYTKSGQVFRISSKGLRHNNLVGDIIVTVKIQIPDKISNEELELYKKLRTLSGESIRKSLLND